MNKHIEKELFEKMQRAALDFHNISIEFTGAMYEVYGTTYSEYDIDNLIDALDYGMKEVSYEYFCEVMSALRNGDTDVSTILEIDKKY
jgi:hypothetical protein